MNKLLALAFAVLLAALALACGDNGGRKLQSITISQTPVNDQFQFVASCNFSRAPNSVTPIPVEWSVQLMAPPPETYQLTTQPFVYQCTASGTFPIVAYAPSNANAPLSGAWTSMISASSTITCP